MRRAALAGLLLLAAYAGLSLGNSPRGFLGTDTGGKVATLEVMSAAGRFDPDLGYWAERWDAEGALHPLAFTTHTASGRWVNVTTLPALWVGWLLYVAGGYRLALLVPMLGSVATAFAARALLRRLGSAPGHAWAGFWIVGLASPMAVYALDFWEHSLGVAMAAWAMVLLVDARDASGRAWWRIAGAGALLGGAATMRTEVLVYVACAGLAWAAIALRRRASLVRVVALGLVLGLASLVPLALNEVAERAVVGSTVRAGRAAGTAVSAGDDPSGRVAEAAITLFGVEGTTGGILLGAGVVALLVFAVRTRDRGMALVAVIGAGALTGLRFLLGGLGFVPGLAPAWVVVVAVAARLPSRLTGGRDGRALLLAVALAAVPLVLATQFRGGAAPQWAGRYLLISGLLLAVVGWAGVEHRPLALRAGLGALAALVTVAGLTWLSVRSHDIDRTFTALGDRHDPVVVSDVYFLGREGGAFYSEQRWLTLSGGTRGRPADAARVLDEAGIDRFASVQDTESRPLSFPGYHRGGARRLPLFSGVDLVVTTWSRNG